MHDGIESANYMEVSSTQNKRWTLIGVDIDHQILFREKLEHWFDPMEITREKIRGLQIEKTDEIESLDSKVQQLASKINGVEHMIESIVTHFNIRLGAPKSDTSLL